MAKRHYITCKICGAKLKKQQLDIHVETAHYTPYQTYLENYYGLKANYYVQITTNFWDYIYNTYQINCIQSEDINQYYQRIFIQNNYNCNLLYKIFAEYTGAIAQYFNFPLNNTDGYNDLIKLIENENSTRSKYNQNNPKPPQYKLKRTNTRPKVKCAICGKEFVDTSLLNYVRNAHKISRKQHLQDLFGLPDELNYNSISYRVARSMYEELQKSPYDNYRDCYKALFKQYGSYEKMSEALGYNVKYACEGLNVAEPHLWTAEEKEEVDNDDNDGTSRET